MLVVNRKLQSREAGVKVGVERSKREARGSV